MKLKELRLEAGFSQADLADASGVKKKSIQDYEQGYRDINGASGIVLYRLSLALKCEIKDLLELDDFEF